MSESGSELRRDCFSLARAVLNKRTGSTGAFTHISRNNYVIMQVNTPGHWYFIRVDPR